MNTKQIQSAAFDAALVGGGVILERVASKGLDKVLEKFAPAIRDAGYYEWAKPVATGVVGIAVTLLATGKHADKIRKIALGMASSSTFNIANKVSKGTLSGTLGYADGAYENPAPYSLLEMASTPPIRAAQSEYEAIPAPAESAYSF